MSVRKLKRVFLTAAVVFSAAMLSSSGTAVADTFGSGANEFTIDFVPISSSTNPASGYGIVEYDYRIGTYEITNDQLSKFQTGNPSSRWAESPADSCWYEAAEFVNWLNTSKGYQKAYNFENGGFQTWTSADAWGGTNLYRHKDAFYFLPDEDEWVKAAYWNGKTLQQYATKAGESLHQGNGTSGTGWNYYAGGNRHSSWNVGSGSEELNGTYDMMGNIWEWMESPYTDGYYADVSSDRGLRGGSWDSYSYNLQSSTREGVTPVFEYPDLFVGFRVASISAGTIPEPGSVLVWVGIALTTLLGCGRRK